MERGLVPPQILSLFALINLHCRTAAHVIPVACLPTLREQSNAPWVHPWKRLTFPLISKIEHVRQLI